MSSMPSRSRGQPQTVLQPAMHLLLASCIVLSMLGQAQAQSFYCFSVTLASSQNQVRNEDAALGGDSYWSLNLRMVCAELEQFCDCDKCGVARRMLPLVCTFECQRPPPPYSIMLQGARMFAQRAETTASMP